MPNIGEDVLVRALITMPGHDEGDVRVVAWTPRTATLVEAGHLEVVHARDPGEDLAPTPVVSPTQASASVTEADNGGDPVGEPAGPDRQPTEPDDETHPDDARPTGSRRNRGR